MLFHQSPLSSRDMLATMERWKSHFTCIAPDSPGFGLSDPLGVISASMNDFADAAIEFMDALGIRRTAVYGVHTGAMISGAIAAIHPDRIVCAVGNGYVMMSEAEKKEIVRRYLPPFTPSWDGSHLTWLWARMRAQTNFFPWYATRLENRLFNGMPPPEALHDASLDFMRSGDHYRVAYRAAFLMKSDRTLKKMRVPMLVTAYATDVLAKHLPRIKNANRRVTVQCGGNLKETLELCRLYLSAHRPPMAPKPLISSTLAGKLVRDYVSLAGGQLRLLKNINGQGRPIVIFHDALGSIDTVETVAKGFIGRRPVFAIELPGHGESDDLLSSRSSSVAAYAGMVRRAITALKFTRIDLVGLGFGGLVGLELGLRDRRLVNALTMIGVADLEGRKSKEFTNKGLPKIVPDWFGGHFLQAWHFVRDQELFSPWYDRQGRSTLRQEPSIDPPRLQQRVLELFRSNGCWRRALDEQASYPWRRRLRTATHHTKLSIALAASDTDPLRESTWRVAKAVPGINKIFLPAAEHRWAAALIKFFDNEPIT